MVQTLQKTVEMPQLQLVDFLYQVVDISVVVQRQFPMVLFRTIEILQLQYTDKVVDVPVVPVQFPSAGVEKTAELPCSSWTRFFTCPLLCYVWCIGPDSAVLAVPQLQFIMVVPPCCFAEADPHGPGCSDALFHSTVAAH